MDAKFRKHLAVAHRELRALLASTPVKADALPIEMPASMGYRGRRCLAKWSGRPLGDLFGHLFGRPFGYAFGASLGKELR